MGGRSVTFNKYYKDELDFLRELGGEFADSHPNDAHFLKDKGSDPDVERLLEGFAFLTARIQLKLDAEHPRFVQHLLETVYPGFLSPVPSMMIARMRPDPLDPNLGRGFTIPRGSALTSELARGQNTHCEFRTAHDVTLWPNTRMSPEVGGKMPVIWLNSVVLPAPLGPRMPTISPRSTASDIASVTTRAP